MEFEDESNLKKKRTNSCLTGFHARALNSHYYTPTKKGYPNCNALPQKSPQLTNPLEKIIRTRHTGGMPIRMPRSRRRSTTLPPQVSWGSICNHIPKN
jgi:hypothetical protein